MMGMRKRLLPLGRSIFPSKEEHVRKKLMSKLIRVITLSFLNVRNVVCFIKEFRPHT